MNMCLHYVKKLAKKFSVLVTLSNFMSINKQRRISMKSFTESKVGYCSLKWMFHGRGVNSVLTYNWRSETDFATKFINTSRFGLNSLRYFA